MKEFTRQNLITLQQEIDAALATVAKKNGIVLSMGNIKFSGEEFHAKLEAAVTSTNSAGLSMAEMKMKKELEDYGRLYGLTGKEYGKTFFSNGRTYKVVGLKTSHPKFPIIGQDVKTGKQFKFTEAVVSKLSK